MTSALIIGASGHLGNRVARRAAALGWAVTGTCFRAPNDTATERLDIRDREQVAALVGRTGPDVVVNCAAGRDDWRLIADGAGHVALATAAAGARLIHVSTDALFTGRDTPYDESALPDPLYRYGAAKAAAETVVAAVDPAAVIVRTSVILGHGTGQHEKLTYDLIAGRARGALFTDMVRMPVHVDDLADALLELAGLDYRGVLNVAGPDAISRYHLGLLVADRAGLDGGRLARSTIAESGLRLPTDVRLDSARARELLSVRLRGVHQFLG